MAELPSDVHPLILKRLPSKSLIRFLTVSKSWYSLIKSPTFINSHKNHHKSLDNNNNNHNKFLWKTNSGCCVMHFHHRGGKHRTQLPSPPHDFANIVAELDGLVCLSQYNNAKLLIWNPSIDRFEMIETPLTVSWSSTCVVGLGYNCVEDDYCVVLINLNHLPADATPSSYHAHVYSLVNKPSLGWKRVSLPTFEDNATSMSPGCFVNDNIHWIMLRGGADCFYKLGSIEFGFAILTFDVKNNCFDQMQLPKALKEAVEPELSLAVIGDSLAIVHLPRQEVTMEWRLSAAVWKMEDYGVEESWKVLYEVNLSRVANTKLWPKEDDKVFVTTSSGILLVLFNVVNGRSYGFYKGVIAITGGQAFAYNESLVLLNDGLLREELEAYRCEVLR